MARREQQTQEKLLEVATEVFYEKGFYGARMQEIADRAGLNKAMLHYYFRNKEQLFDAVFEKALEVLMPALVRFFSQDVDLEEKISRLIHEYTTLLQNNPHVPVFIMSELRMHPEKMSLISQSAPFQTGHVIEQIEEEIRRGNIRPIHPQHFVMHLFSSCIFPYISSFLWRGFFQLDQAAYQQLLEERKQSLMDTFWYSLKP